MSALSRLERVAIAMVREELRTLGFGPATAEWRAAEDHPDLAMNSYGDLARAAVRAVDAALEVGTEHIQKDRS